MLVFCLGQFRVEINGLAVEIPSRPAQSLFAYLALTAGMVHRREKLAGLLWPDSSEENARGYLRQGLWRIRKGLEAAGAAWQDFLAIDEISICFIKQPGVCLDSEQATRQKSGDLWTIEELIEDLRVYTGELLPGFFDEWVILEREKIKFSFDQKMGILLEKLEDDQRWDDLLEWSERWIGLGHLPEPAYRAVMVSQAVRGSSAGVTAAFQRCKKALRDELGVSPSKEMTATYEQLLRGQIPAPVRKPQLDLDIIASEPPAAGQAPYKGLAFFETVDSGLFFGRERLVSHLVKRLEENHLLFLVGASGSGKSSIVRAGVVPAFQSLPQVSGIQSPPASRAAVQAIVMTPSARPLQSLCEALGQDQALVSEMLYDAHALNRAVREQAARSGSDRSILVVDQFEEIFTLCADETEREAFLNNLLAACQDGRDGSVYVVIVLRADFYARCGTNPSLRAALSSHQEYIGPMTTEELRSAIEEPAIRSGWRFEAGLVDLILREVRSEPGALPLLSHALLETWKRRSGRWLTLKGYAEAGGVHGAIAHTAESVFNRQLSAGQQRTAQNIFLRISELSEDLTGTRRRADISEFRSDPAGGGGLDDVLNILAAARLITLSEKTVEIAHEALILEWPTLRRWLVEDREGLRLQHQLAEAARQWLNLEQDPAELLRGARLAHAVEWSGKHPDRLNPLEHEFLQAGLDEEHRLQREKDEQRQRELEAARQLAIAEKRRAEEQSTSIRRLRLFTAAISVIFLVTLAAAWIAVDQRNQANRASLIAHSRELAAASVSNLSLDPQLSILLALEAINESRAAREPVSAEIESALHQAVRFSRQRLVLRGHQLGIFGSTFSPDGSQVATASNDSTIKIWDSGSGELIRTLEGHSGEVILAIFHPSERRLASSSRDHTIRYWDLETGKEIWSLRDELSFPTGLAFSKDGSRLAAAIYSGKIILIKSSTGEIEKVIETNPLIYWVGYNPEGSVVATSDSAGVVQLFDSITGEMEDAINFSTRSQTFFAFRPDGKELAVTSLDGFIELFDLSSQKIRLVITGPPGSLYGPLNYSPDGRFLVASSFAHNAQVWEAETGHLVMTLNGHSGRVLSASFHPDGRQILTGSFDGTARIWDFSPAREAAVIEAPQGENVMEGGRRAVFSPDGLLLAAGEGDKGQIGLWDASSGSRVDTLTPGSPSAAVVSVDFHPDGKRIVSGDMDGKIVVWDLAKRAALTEWAAHDTPVFTAIFNHAGDQIFSLGLDGTIKSWYAQTGAGIGIFHTHGEAFHLALSKDDTAFLKATYFGAVSLTDLKTGKSLRDYRGQIGKLWDVAFSHDEKMIASASDDGSVILWDAASGKKIHTLPHPMSKTVGVAFHPDDHLLATVSLNATLRLWDTATGRQLLVLDNVSAMRPSGVVFSPDGKSAAVSSAEGIALFLVELEDLIQLAKTRLTRSFTSEECAAYSISGDCGQAENPLTALPVDKTTAGRRLACHLPESGTNTLALNRIPNEGMISAAVQLGWDTWMVEPIFTSDLRENMQKFVLGGCDLIIITTFDPATLAVPEDHPEQRYLFVTAENEHTTWDNVWNGFYAEEQPSFLAGYLAADMTRTGKVGVFGGEPISAVLRFMNGFAQGVDYYNQRNASSVELIGWQADGDPGQGIFTGFIDDAYGYKTTLKLIASGADIIFPVAGEWMMAAASEAALTQEGTLVIGVDQDWAADYPKYAAITLTSVIKRLDKHVYLAMEAITQGTFTGGNHYGTLENGGVDLAPFHPDGPKVPDEIKANLEAIRKEIIEGKIKISLPQPQR